MTHPYHYVNGVARMYGFDAVFAALVWTCDSFLQRIEISSVDKSTCPIKCLFGESINACHMDQ